MTQQIEPVGITNAEVTDEELAADVPPADTEGTEGLS